MAIPPDRNMHSDKASTSTNEGRKSSKPIMEKRRRARINASLTELKTLLLEVKKTEGSRHGKMEKADILEMTVKHLRQLQRQQFTGSPKTDSSVLNNYRLGFDECAQEVTRYLSQMDISDVNLRTKILDHLASCVSSGIFNPSPPSTPVSSAPPSVSPQSQTSGSSPQLQIPPLPQMASSPSLVYSQLSPEQPTLQTLSATATHQPIPSSNAVQMANVINTVQLIPTKLHTGEIAFVMPNTVLSNSAPAPSYIIPVYPTASSSASLQTTQTAPTTTITVPNMSVPTLPVVPTPQHVAPPRSVSTASSNQVLNTSAGLSLPAAPTIAPFHPNVSLIPQRPPPPSPAQLLPLEPRPLFQAENNADRNIAHGREEPQQNREESMWRPW